MKTVVRFLLFALGMTQAVAATCDLQEPTEGDRVAAFRLYVPDSVRTVRSVIVLVPGLDGDGRGMADDPGWQSLAERTHSGLLGCFFQGKSGGSYFLADRWSGPILLEALRNLARISGHPDVEEAPLALWGHSAGGQFNFNFANWKPERTVAFVANKGAYYGKTISPGVRSVPGLWILGENDTEVRRRNITARYESGRMEGALWALVPEPGEGHGIGRSREIGRMFLEEVLAARVDVSGRMQAMDPGQGWLGDRTNKTVTPNPGPTAGPAALSWFPGERSARLWVDILEGRPDRPAKTRETQR